MSRQNSRVGAELSDEGMDRRQLLLGCISLLLTGNAIGVLRERKKRSASAVYGRSVAHLNPANPVIATEESKQADRLKNLNLNAIEDLYDVDKQLIKDIVSYMIQKHNLTPQGAAYLTGNFIWESRLNPNIEPGDNGTAFGIAQWRFKRREGMPDDLYGQIDFALNTEMIRDGAVAYLPELLRDPNATRDAIEQGLRDWERWRVEGARFEFGAVILEQIQSPVS